MRRGGRGVYRVVMFQCFTDAGPRDPRVQEKKKILPRIHYVAAGLTGGISHVSMPLGATAIVSSRLTPEVTTFRERPAKSSKGSYWDYNNNLQLISSDGFFGVKAPQPLELPK